MTSLLGDGTSGFSSTNVVDIIFRWIFLADTWWSGDYMWVDNIFQHLPAHSTYYNIPRKRKKRPSPVPRKTRWRDSCAPWKRRSSWRPPSWPRVRNRSRSDRRPRLGSFWRYRSYRRHGFFLDFPVEYLKPPFSSRSFTWSHDLIPGLSVAMFGYQRLLGPYRKLNTCTVDLASGQLWRRVLAIWKA